MDVPELHPQREHPETPPAGPHGDARAATALDYLQVLWRWRVAIALGTLLAAGAALTLALLTPRSYRATATVLVGWSKLSSEAAQSSGMSTEWAKTFEAVVKSEGALAATLAHFKLAEPPDEMSTRALQNSIDVEALRDTSLVQISAEMSSPQLAAEVANFLAQRIMALNDDLNDAEMGSSRTFVENEAKLAAANLQAARGELLQFQQAANLDILRKQLEVRLERLSQLEIERQNVALGLANANAEIGRLDKDLGGQTKTLKMRRHLANDAAYQGALGKLSGTRPEELLGLAMDDEEVNPTYAFLERRLVEARAAAAALGARRDQIERLAEENAAGLERVQDELVAKSVAQEQMRHSYDVASDADTLLRQRLQAANLDVASKSTVLKLVDPALPPDRHAWPKRMLITAVGGIIGLLVMLAFALILESVRRVRVATQP